MDSRLEQPIAQKVARSLDMQLRSGKSCRKGVERRSMEVGNAVVSSAVIDQRRESSEVCQLDQRAWNLSLVNEHDNPVVMRNNSGE
jgi:hypothetical protein